MNVHIYRKPMHISKRATREPKEHQEEKRFLRDSIPHTSMKVESYILESSRTFWRNKTFQEFTALFPQSFHFSPDKLLIPYGEITKKKKEEVQKMILTMWCPAICVGNSGGFAVSPGCGADPVPMARID